MVKWSDKEAAVKSLLRGGRVDPADLIEAARAESHPCHADFTWDIGQAASERWRDQARKIIRQCKFEVIVEDVATPVVSYVSSPEDEDDTFVSVANVRSFARVSAVMASEVTMLHGVVARGYGIALAKQGIVGEAVVSELKTIRDSVKALRDGLLEE
ncbi:hypothetical protein LCGC14_2584270 [marine sediment metagenome]|uniref:Uncharacterized protein n=1 Tax=marine sediment metagenome TaxID=412755 RepID=A0A0F9ADW7_9ZZZZ